MTQSAPEHLFLQATELQRNGRSRDAERLYRRILEEHPDHAPSLSRLGALALGARRFEEAETLMRTALEAAPEDAGLNINLGVCLQATGRAAEALECFDRAARLDPRVDVAWLYLGATRAATGDPQAAVRAFQVALMVNPQLEKVAAMQGHPAQRLAAQAVQATQAQYRALQTEALESLAGRCGPDTLRRVEKCLRIQHGLERPAFPDPLQRPEMLFLPGLEPRPWFEREEFDWVERVEAATGDLREEVLALCDSREGFTPYVAHAEAAPEPMKHLAGSFDWHAFHLYASGERRDENCRRCPRTTALVDSLPLVECRGTSPEAFFSILQPGTHIKPHFGVANTKVAVHVPLVIPENCGIRVGPETRQWQEGRCLIFDDSYEHEAWNRSESLRIVFIFEVWNPGLSPEEREAIQLLCRVSRDWAEEVVTEETRG